jgi:hypothetical protein
VIYIRKIYTAKKGKLGLVFKKTFCRILESDLKPKKRSKRKTRSYRQDKKEIVARHNEMAAMQG